MQTSPPPDGAERVTGGKRGARGPFGVVGTALLALLAKGKGALALLKALPFAKVLLTGGTFGLTVFAYAARGGLPFALAFALLILIHELGHGAAMKAAGVRAGWPVFIPFFGAFIAMKDQPAHPTVEARIAYAGPVAGTGASLVCAAAGLFLHTRFFLSLAYMGFFLNLFNLVPLGFLDGARVARVFSRGAWIVGILLMAGMFLAHPSPQLLLIGIIGLRHTLGRSNEDLARVTDEERRAWAMRYFGLCFFLGAATMATHRLLEPAMP